jgi:hypothetical protein
MDRGLVDDSLPCPLCGGELVADPRAPMAHRDCARGCRARHVDAWIAGRWAQLGLGPAPAVDVGALSA